MDALTGTLESIANVALFLVGTGLLIYLCTRIHARVTKDHSEFWIMIFFLFVLVDFLWFGFSPILDWVSNFVFDPCVGKEGDFIC